MTSDAAFQGPEVVGVIEDVLGDVRRRPQGVLIWDPLRPGDTLLAGDSVLAGDGAWARVALSAGGTIALDPSTFMGFDRVPAPADYRTTLTLTRGGLRAASGESGLTIQDRQGARIELYGTGQTAVRAEEATAVEVLDGTAWLQPSGAYGRALMAGEGATLSSDVPILVRSLPVRLLSPSPEARTVYSASEGATVEFAWRAVGRYQGPFALELSRDPDFTSSTTYETSKSEIRVRGLAPGLYHWRVASGSERSTHHKLNVVRDQPVTLLSPQAESRVVAGTRVRLAWRPVEAVARYRVHLGAATLEIAKTSLFYFVPVATPSGRMCFQVQPLDPMAPRAGSERRCFEVVPKPLLQAPQLFAPEFASDPTSASVFSDPRGVP